MGVPAAVEQLLPGSTGPLPKRDRGLPPRRPACANGLGPAGCAEGRRLREGVSVPGTGPPPAGRCLQHPENSLSSKFEDSGRGGEPAAPEVTLLSGSEGVLSPGPSPADAPCSNLKCLLSNKIAAACKTGCKLGSHVLPAAPRQDVMLETPQMQERPCLQICALSDMRSSTRALIVDSPQGQGRNGQSASTVCKSPARPEGISHCSSTVPVALAPELALSLRQYLDKLLEGWPAEHVYRGVDPMVDTERHPEMPKGCH